MRGEQMSDRPIQQLDPISSNGQAQSQTQSEAENNFMTLAELEKRHIEYALSYFKGSKAKTAQALGISLKTLYNKLHTYGMMATDRRNKFKK
jgi:DNA-binding NtrC family response regulator